MKNFEFYSPTKVYFGKDGHTKVGDILKGFGANKVLIHYGSERVNQSGLMEQVKASITAAGLEFVMLGGVVPNPRVSLVRKGKELAQKEGVDFILAVGGGSVIDSSKSIALACANDCDIWDLFLTKETPKGALPTGNIVTLAAAGSETSKSSVLTNEDGWIKIGLNSEFNRPRFTIMNPELLYSLPPYQTASGVVDIMMHTMDRYFSDSGYTEVTDRIAEQIMKVAYEYGKKCMENPEDYEARSEVMWAGSISHNDLTGLGRIGDWATHKLEHELSGKFDVAHGAGLSALWGTWARYVYQCDVMRFARYGVNVLGLSMDYANPENTALEAIRRTEEFFTSIGMPITIKELLGKDITDEDIADMTEKCSKGGTIQVGNFKKLGKAEIAEIYKLAR